MQGVKGLKDANRLSSRQQDQTGQVRFVLQDSVSKGFTPAYDKLCRLHLRCTRAFSP